MKNFKFLYLTLILLVNLSCETSDKLLTTNELSSKIEIKNSENKSIDVYNVVSSNINLDNYESKNNYTSITSEQSPILNQLLVSKIDFSLKDKLFIVTDNDGIIYEYDLVANLNLDYQGRDNETIYTLNPKSTKLQARGPWCRVGCYGIFALMASADGPAPIADIIAAVALAECLYACEQQ